MGCATGTVKYLLFIANLVFALTGLALLVVGVIYLIDIDEVKDAIPSDLKSIEVAPILTIVVGSIIFLVSFLGCCGAIKESTCLLTSFAVILLSIFIIQVAIGVFAFLKVKDTGDLEGQIETTFKDLIIRYNSSSNPSNEVVDLIQVEFKCCGGSGYTDYDYNSIPASCCDSRNTTESPCVLFKEGCADKLVDLLQSRAHVIGYVIISTTLVEILSSIFALCLSSSIKNEDRRNKYTR